MKVNFVFVLFFALFVTLVSAVPALKTAPEGTEWKSLFSEAEVNDLGDLRVKENVQQKEEHGLRFRRVTCDLLSVSLPIGSLNHAGCAAHCLAKRKGYRGGRCKNGVCHCRK